MPAMTLKVRTGKKDVRVNDDVDYDALTTTFSVASF